jgi:hypothetical protein
LHSRICEDWTRRGVLTVTGTGNDGLDNECLGAPSITHL